MKTRLLAVGFCLLLAGCGPLIGFGSWLRDGIGDVTVTGDPAPLRTGGELLVFAPFAKTDQAFYICRGEEAIRLAEELQRQGLFTTAVHLEREPGQLAGTANRLRTLSAAALKDELRLAREPRWLLFGTLVAREETAMPLRGVVMETVYRLEFYDIAARTSTVFEIEGHFLAEEMEAGIVAELGRRIGR